MNMILKVVNLWNQGKLETNKNNIFLAWFIPIFQIEKVMGNVLVRKKVNINVLY